MVTDPVTLPTLLALDKPALRGLIERRLRGTQPPDASTPLQFAGISPEQAAQLQHLLPKQRIAAAVLVPVVDRGAELTLLFTQRASHLRSHAGQISFPGGRIEPADGGPVGTALRETEEEIGLEHSFIDVIGFLPPLLVMTGYSIAPVVGFVRPGFELQPHAGEVADVFEVPLKFILDPRNHEPRQRVFGDVVTMAYDLPYYDLASGERRIWGATAAMLMSFYHLLTHGDRDDEAAFNLHP